jgi:hypothetical protein
MFSGQRRVASSDSPVSSRLLRLEWIAANREQNYGKSIKQPE